MRDLKITEGEFYHIYNRGAGKQKIFHDQEDHQRFLKLMYICNNRKKFKFKDLIKRKKDIYSISREDLIVSVSCYVLMPNHFHILISSTFPKGGQNISDYIKKICIGYTQYYNQKYGRTGTLFEGRFKAEHVDNDRYLKYLLAYIHLNPIKLIQSDWKSKGIKNLAAAKSFLESYFHSSYSNYILSTFPKGGQEKIVDVESIYKVFPKKTNFKDDLFEWLKYKN